MQRLQNAGRGPHSRVQAQWRTPGRAPALYAGSLAPGITEAVGNLQQKNLLTYCYGRITIRTRRRLERAACECCGIITEGLKYVLP